MNLTARLDSVDDGIKFVGGAGGVAIFLTLVAFLAMPQVTIFPLVAFLGIVGYGWYAFREQTAVFLTFLTTVSTALILGLITVFLLLRSIPAFQTIGLDLFLPSDGGTAAADISILPMIWGTFVTTVLAMLIAGPLGVAGAVFLSEIAPKWAREVTKPAIEILAGIPSIVYGFLGFVVLNPYFSNEWGVPTFGSFFAVGLVIGLMALPTVISIAEDALNSIPDPMKDGAHALGATDWQTTTSVTLPAAFSGVSAAVLLGVGRVVGETMAATVILANVAELPDMLTDVFANKITLTSFIAARHGTASGLSASVLFAAGVVLFVTVMFLSIGSQLVERHMQRKLGGEK